MVLFVENQNVQPMDDGSDHLTLSTKYVTPYIVQPFEIERMINCKALGCNITKSVEIWPVNLL